MDWKSEIGKRSFVLTQGKLAVRASVVLELCTEPLDFGHEPLDNFWVLFQAVEFF